MSDCFCGCVEQPKEGNRYVHGHNAKGTSNPAWKGGRGKTNKGYVWRHMPWHPNAGKHGRVYEHVLIVTIAIKRPLKKGEEVHHINGIKDDNRPSNLFLTTKAEHAYMNGKLRGGINICLER